MQTFADANEVIRCDALCWQGQPNTSTYRVLMSGAWYDPGSGEHWEGPWELQTGDQYYLWNIHWQNSGYRGAGSARTLLWWGPNAADTNTVLYDITRIYTPSDTYWWPQYNYSLAAPSTGDCPYGTQPKSTTDPFVFVTDAFLESLKGLFGWTRLGGVFNPLLGVSLNTTEICSQLPATLPPFEVSQIITIGARALEQLKIMAWYALCECRDGPTPPTPPERPPVVEDPNLPRDRVIIVNPTNPCLDLTEVRRMLDELLRLVQVDYSLDTLMQRYSLPFATIRGATHSGLTGTGSIAIPRCIGVQVVVTANLPGRSLEGAPPYVWDVGWASLMDDNGFIQERRITRGVEVWLPRGMQEATTFGYVFKDGVVASVTELYAEP